MQFPTESLFYRSFILIVILIVSAYLYKKWYTVSFADVNILLPSLSNSKILKMFSEDYNAARKLFRKNSQKWECHSLKVEAGTLDLSIDIAVLRRSKTKMLIHVSGTHGVEGFAGSAIQSSLLQCYKTEENGELLPTIVIIHALNPYGFATLRRVNENGSFI
jgi:hypothetical protein